MQQLPHLADVLFQLVVLGLDLAHLLHLAPALPQSLRLRLEVQIELLQLATQPVDLQLVAQVFRLKTILASGCVLERGGPF
jgi:hypothetical protein